MTSVPESSGPETAAAEYQCGGENSVSDEVVEFDAVTIAECVAWMIFEDPIRSSLRWDFDHGHDGGIGECHAVEEYVT